MGFMGIAWLLVLGLIVWAVVAATRPHGTETKERSRSALEILEERYARGEIDTDEYRRRRTELERK